MDICRGFCQNVHPVDGLTVDSTDALVVTYLKKGTVCGDLPHSNRTVNLLKNLNNFWLKKKNFWKLLLGDLEEYAKIRWKILPISYKFWVIRDDQQAPETLSLIKKKKSLPIQENSDNNLEEDRRFWKHFISFYKTSSIYARRQSFWKVKMES